MFRPQISLIFMLHFWEKVRKTWGSNNTLTEYWDLIERKKIIILIIQKRILGGYSENMGYRMLLSDDWTLAKHLDMYPLIVPHIHLYIIIEHNPGGSGRIFFPSRANRIILY